MTRVLLECGAVIYVAWLRAAEGVEVRHTCRHGAWHGGEHVAPIVKVLS